MEVEIHQVAMTLQVLDFPLHCTLRKLMDLVEEFVQ
jgi:hypothetical protein